MGSCAVNCWLNPLKPPEDHPTVPRAAGKERDQHLATSEPCRLFESIAWYPRKTLPAILRTKCVVLLPMSSKMDSQSEFASNPIH
jgi:hypothetical protein